MRRTLKADATKSKEKTMQIQLEWDTPNQMAVLTVFDTRKGKRSSVKDIDRTEVRGNYFVGSKYTGDQLDRLVDALPKVINISELFTGAVINLRKDTAKIVRDFLANEDILRNTVLSSKEEVPYQTKVYDDPPQRELRRVQRLFKEYNL